MEEGGTGYTRSGFHVCTHKAAAEQGEQQPGVKRKNMKKEAQISHLPPLQEVESCADVGDPVDPLYFLTLLTWLEGKWRTMKVERKKQRHREGEETEIILFVLNLTHVWKLRA